MFSKIIYNNQLHEFSKLKPTLNFAVNDSKLYEHNMYWRK